MPLPFCGRCFQHFFTTIQSPSLNVSWHSSCFDHNILGVNNFGHKVSLSLGSVLRSVTFELQLNSFSNVEYRI